jgi:hypothetical protein
MPSTPMHHDLSGMVIEATLGLRGGFWSCVEQGATFKSTTRKRTQPGVAVIKANASSLQETERLIHHHEMLWRRGQVTPVATALTEMALTWAKVGPREELVVEWPSLRTQIVKQIDSQES